MDKMIDNSKLKVINTESATAQAISNELKQRQRIHHFIDITRFRRNLVKSGKPVAETDYMKYWKSLQNEGAGSIVYGRKGKPDRFLFNYSLKDIAAASVPSAVTKPVKRSPGRPKGSKNRVNLSAKQDVKGLKKQLIKLQEELRVLVSSLK